MGWGGAELARDAIHVLGVELDGVELGEAFEPLAVLSGAHPFEEVLANGVGDLFELGAFCGKALVSVEEVISKVGFCGFGASGMVGEGKGGFGEGFDHAREARGGGRRERGKGLKE